MRSETHETKINLNDLLKKAQERKREENKINILIVSLVLFVAIVVIGVFSI